MMRNAPPIVRALLGVLAGVLASVLVVMVAAAFTGRPRAPRLVPEDASGHLRRIAIHYVPAMDGQVMPVWRDLFGALPDDVEVIVAVSKAADFDRLVERLRGDGVGRLERFRRVVVDRPLTTWSRDRMASLDDGVLASPRVPATSGARIGDWEAPVAISRAVYGDAPRVADLVFEGGDLAASREHLFADANLIGRNLGRGDASRARLEASLRRTFGQELVWLGEGP